MAKLLENIHREYGVNTRFIELAGEVNRAMPEWVVGKIAQALNERGKAIEGSKILVTDHDAFDYKLITRHVKLLVDTRGRYPKPQSHIFKA